MGDIKLAAAITLYYANSKIIDYIVSIQSYFKTIYLFDNTESKEYTDSLREYLKKQPGIKYVAKNHNMGLAYALNVCCNAAYKDGFEWIMLFDQDSIITEKLLYGMKTFIYENDEDNLAIVAPMIDDISKRHNIRVKKAIKKEVVITSGMILKLEIFKKNGYFSNALFIDAVDTEFCLRLLKNGYFILQNNQVALNHNQYDSGKVIDGYKVNKYSALRHYYLARSYFYIRKNYSYEKRFIKQFKADNYQRLKGCLLYDNHRIKKLLAVLLGSLDYRLKRFGKCRWKLLM